MQIADGLAGHVVGGVPLLAVPGLVEAQDERRLAQCLAQQGEPLGADRLHRPRGLGQKVVQRLGVGVDGRAQARQGLAPRLGEQAQVQRGELLEVAHVVEQAALMGAVLVEEGHRRGSRTHTGHGAASCRRPHPAHRVPNMTDEGSGSFVLLIALAGRPWGLQICHYPPCSCNTANGDQQSN